MKKTASIQGAAVAIAALSIALPTMATITPIVSSPSDYTCQTAAGVCNNASSATDAIGFAGGSPSWCAILMFPLPTLPSGMIIGNQTTLTVTLNSVGSSVAMNGDLWGIANFRTDIPAASGAPNSSFYYYLGSNPGPGSNATPSDVKILDNYLTPSLIGKPSGTAVTTAFGASNSLQAYIQSFYTANPTYNASASQAYVWLRINCDGPTSSTATRYVINAGDTGVGSTLRPTLNLDISPPPAAPPLVWNGNLSPVWDVNTTANWTSNGVAGFNYVDGDVVQFDSTLTGSASVTLNSTVLPSSVTFNSSTNYSLTGTGKISGTNALTKLGVGTLILDTDNDYSGGTTLGVGTLQIGNNDTHGAIGSGSVAVTVAGTTLAYNRTDALTISDVYYSGGTPNVVVNSGALSLGGTGDNIATIATVNSGGTLVLAKASSGSAHALGTSSTINAGGLMQLGGTGGDQIYKNCYIADNGTFDMAGLSEGFNGLNGAGLVTNSASSASVLQLGDGNGTAAFTGKIVDGAGQVAVTKTGTGMQTLTGANTYTGATTVQGGELVVSTAQTGGGAFSINDGGALGVSVAAPGGSLNVSSLSLGFTTLEFQNVGSTSVAPISAGSLSLGDVVTINITSGTFVPGQSYPLIAFSSGSGNGCTLGKLPVGVFGTLDTSGNPVMFQVSSVPLTWNGDASAIWNIQSAPNWKGAGVNGLTYFDGGAVTFDDSLTGTPNVDLTDVVAPALVTVSNTAETYVISGGGHITGATLVVKTGSGKVIFDTDNDYAGGTVLSGGTLQVGNNDTHGSIGTGAFTNLVPGSILAFNRTDSLDVGTVTRTTVDNSAQVVVNSGIVRLTGSADNAGTLATVNAGGRLVLAKVSNANVHALSGPGLLINPGGAMILGGTGGDQLYTASGVIDNGVFDMGGTSEGFDLLTGSGLVTNSSAPASLLTLGQNNGTGTFNGAIVDGAASVAVTKTGTGTLTLAGTNTYTGATLISAGKLVTTTASSGGGSYTAVNGTTLAVNVVSANGSLAVSSLNLGSSSSATLELQNLNSVTTPAISAGSVTLNGVVTVNITGGAFVAGQDYPLVGFTSLSGGASAILGSLPKGVNATLVSVNNPNQMKLHVSYVVNQTPTNIVAGVTNGVLTLQWPGDRVGWTVQSNSVDIGDTNAWFSVPGSTATNSLNVPVNNGAPHVFYRLRY